MKILTDIEFKTYINLKIHGLMDGSGKTYRAQLVSVARQLDYMGLVVYMGLSTASMKLSRCNEIVAFFEAV